VAEELGIPARLLYKWRRELLKDPEPPVSGDQVSLKAEVQRLRRENERLLEERTILKKAIRYFATEEEEERRGTVSSRATQKSFVSPRCVVSLRCHGVVTMTG
jgi:transposase